MSVGLGKANVGSLHTNTLSLRVGHDSWDSHKLQYLRILQSFPNLQHLSLSLPPSTLEIPAGVKVLSIRLNYESLSDGFEHHPLPRADRENRSLFRTADHIWRPSLRKLQIENAYFTSWEYVPLAKQATALIEDLRLIDCHNPHRDQIFRDTLFRMVSLKRFLYVINTSWQFRVHPDYVPGMLWILLKNMASLEEFVLCPYPGTYENGFPKFGQRKDKHNIRKLAAPEALFRENGMTFGLSDNFQVETLVEFQVQFAVNIGDFRGSDRTDDRLSERV